MSPLRVFHARLGGETLQMRAFVGTLGCDRSDADG